MKERKYNPFFPDHDGLHRRKEHRYWKYIYPVPVELHRIKPGDILLVRSKSVIGALIIYLSEVDGKRAWLNHAGQILDDYMVSEANYPYHAMTSLSDYIEAEREGEVRLTVVRLKESVFPDIETKKVAYSQCKWFHTHLDYYSSVREYLECHGHPYNSMSLVPMAVISLIRNHIPFLKTGRWKNIPSEKQEVVFICSGIVKWGWGWLMRKIKVDLFPSSLSLMVPSPQDIYDSPYTEYVCGWKKDYYNILL